MMKGERNKDMEQEHKISDDMTIRDIVTSSRIRELLSTGSGGHQHPRLSNK